MSIPLSLASKINCDAVKRGIIIQYGRLLLTSFMVVSNTLERDISFEWSQNLTFLLGDKLRRNGAGDVELGVVGWHTFFLGYVGGYKF